MRCSELAFTCLTQCAIAWLKALRITYETASERMDRASRVIRGDDSHFMSTTTALLIGVGLGVSVGLLFAPASGEEIRSNLADKVQDFGDKVRNRFSPEPQPASGTYGE